VRNHRIRKGETLYSIAAREYGDPLEWLTLQEANPWLDPENLRPGDIIYIPARSRGGGAFKADPYDRDMAAAAPVVTDPPTTRRRFGNPGTSGDEASEGGGFESVRAIFRNLGGGRTVFGEPVEKLGVLLLGGFFFHGFVQAFLIWIVSTISFVKDVTFSKSLKAVFHAEILTLFSVVILGGVALFMLHVGNAPAPGEGSDAGIAGTIEMYLGRPAGLGVAGMLGFGLYLLFCLRLVPSTLGLRRAQSLAIMVLGVLAPHILAVFAIGQRLGWIAG